MRYGTQCLNPTDPGTLATANRDASQLAEVNLARESRTFQHVSHRENTALQQHFIHFPEGVLWCVWL